MLIITGAAGQLGQAVILKCLENGEEVCGCDIEPMPLSFLGKLSSWFQIDLASPPKGFTWPKNATAVLHLAGSKFDLEFSFKSAMSLLRENLKATLGALATCENNISRFIYVSSISVYSLKTKNPICEESIIEPVSMYGVTKWLGELACRLFKKENKYIELIIIRLTQVYGPGTWQENAIYKLINQALSYKQLTLTCDKSIKRDYIYLTDAAEALNMAVFNCVPGIYNIGFGKAISMGKIAKIISEAIPCSLTPRFLKNKGTDRYLDTTRFSNSTNFKPVISHSEGIRKEVARIILEK